MFCRASLFSDICKKKAMDLQKKVIVMAAALLALMACDSNVSQSDGNGIYYWRTDFSLNRSERNFLRQHEVNRLYVHFFDVTRDWDAKPGKEIIVPEATVRFNDSIPEGVEIVPTVYITTRAMELMQRNEGVYAEKILKRVRAICRRKGIEFNELQLDCDWTKSTRGYFYRLCEEMKRSMDSTQTLSSTIRLHQLTQTPPPVDKGVLMVYNTGNLMEMTTDNSIFSIKDIEPYLRDNRLADYTLPLDVAYPAYGWSIVYNPEGNGFRFGRIMKRTDFSAYPAIKKIDKNTYVATDLVDLTPDVKSGDWIYKGCRIRVERPTAREIMEVKRLIERQLNGKPHTNILYHLDKSQLYHYESNEIDKIYSRN